MSDDCERLFSSAKLLITDRRSCLKMDIIEANECLRAGYGNPRKGIFDDKAIGVEGEQRDKSGERDDEESDEDKSPVSTTDEEVDEDVTSHISIE